MKPFFKFLLVVFLIILLLTFLLDSRPFAFFSVLSFGWFNFFQRTLPKLTWNWDLIGMALLSTAIILFLAHKFLTGLSKSIAAKRGANWRWPWKWTWSLLTAVLLLFLVGMAVGGTTHQIGWIASSPESMFERKPFYFIAVNEMKEIELAIRLASGETNEQIENVRKEFWKTKEELFGPRVDVTSMIQKYCVLVLVNDDQKVLGTIIFPRDSTLRQKVGGYCSSYETKDRFEEHLDHRWEKISELLKKYRGHLVSF